MAFSVFGGDQSEFIQPDGSMLYSPETLRGRRAYAAQLMRDKRENKNAGDGLYNATNSIMAAMLMRNADEADAAMLKQQQGIGKLQSDSLVLPGSNGQQQTYAVPGDSNTKGMTPPTPSAWTMALDQHVPEQYKPLAAALLKGEGGTTGAKSSTGAWGGYQFLESTGKEHGLVGPGFDNRNDPEAATKAFVALTEKNRGILAERLGREPTPQELALAHQQGAGGAAALIGNPNARAGDVINPRNLQVNRIDPNMPAGAAAQKIMQYYAVPQNDVNRQPQPYQVAQNGPRSDMPVQVAPGLYTYGGGTGSGVTPQHIQFAKAVMANPSVATPAQIEMAKDIYKRAQEPGELQDIGNNKLRDKQGNIFYNQPNAFERDGKVWKYTPNGDVVPAQVAGNGMGGPNDDGIGGTRSPNQLGLSEQQKELLKTYADGRAKYIADAPQLAQERVKLGGLQGALSQVALRGPFAEAAQPIFELAQSLGVPIVQAQKGQEAEAIRATLGNIVGDMYGRSQISDGDRKAAMKAIAGIGSFKNTEEALMNILYNANERRTALGMVASAYNQGRLNDAQYIRLHDSIANDMNVGQNFHMDDEGGLHYKHSGMKNPISVRGMR